jgi:hypothetical protein
MRDEMSRGADWSGFEAGVAAWLSAAAKGGGASWLRWARLVAAVAARGTHSRTWQRVTAIKNLAGRIHLKVPLA